MSWWRKLFQRLLGSGSVPAQQPLPTVEKLDPTLDASPRPGPPHQSRHRTQRSAPPVVRSDAPPAPVPPVVDAPITTPPEAARPVAITLPDTLTVPTSPAPMPAPPIVEALAPAAPVAYPTEPTPETSSAPTVPDDHFELPDFSHIPYPEVPGGFASPLLAAETGRHDAGRTKFAPRVAAGLVSELGAAQAYLETVLKDEPIVVSLPSQGSTPRAYALASLPSYFVDTVRQAPRTLTTALTAPDHLTEGGGADPLDRLELTRLVGRLLKGLHDQQHLTAGIDLESFAYSLQPRPAVALLKGDLVRRIGGDFLNDSPLDANPSMDNDRHGFAELARQLLAPDDQPGRGITGLDDEQVRQAERLWTRANGPIGTRPQISEWLAVLG